MKVAIVNDSTEIKMNETKAMKILNRRQQSDTKS